MISMPGGERPLDPWYLEHLRCPRDHSRLHLTGGRLECAAAHSYPIVDGLPVMLIDDVRQTIGIAHASLSCANGDHAAAAPLYLETLGLSDDERAGIAALARRGSPIDPVVAFAVAATNGIMYRHLIGILDRYPIPELRLPPGDGLLLDVGCSWGRWSLAAAGLGYHAVGLDPSLGAVMAARRVAEELRLRAHFVVGDARFLPFGADAFDTAFSYSVLQHLSREDAAAAVTELGRVLTPGGASLVQMPTKFGARCLYHQMRRGFRAPEGFEVRYWTVAELRRLFAAVGPSRVSVDCFFGIGLQKTDRELMPAARRLMLTASETLRAASDVVPALTYLADSVYVRAERPGPATPALGVHHG